LFFGPVKERRFDYLRARAATLKWWPGLILKLPVSQTATDLDGRSHSSWAGFRSSWQRRRHFCSQRRGRHCSKTAAAMQGETVLLRPEFVLRICNNIAAVIRRKRPGSRSPLAAKCLVWLFLVFGARVLERVNRPRGERKRCGALLELVGELALKAERGRA